MTSSSKCPGTSCLQDTRSHNPRQMEIAFGLNVLRLLSFPWWISTTYAMSLFEITEDEKTFLYVLKTVQHIMAKCIASYILHISWISIPKSKAASYRNSLWPEGFLVWIMANRKWRKCFRLTGPLRGQFTRDRQIPSQRASNRGLWWVFFYVGLNKLLNKQSSQW